MRLFLGPRDPGDAASNGAPFLDPRGKVMAEEHRAGVHPDEALAEMGKEGHAHHDIWSEIQEAEAIGVHDVLEEIREGGIEPAREIVDEEGIPIWAGLGEIGGDDARGRVPRRLPPP